MAVRNETDSLNLTATIFKINVDDSMLNQLVSVHPNLINYNFGITVYYTKGIIYWVYGRQVQYTNLDGDYIETNNITVPENPRLINAHREWMHISDLTSIWWLEQKIGEFAIRVAPQYGNSVNQPISGVQ